MTLDSAIRELRARAEPVPVPLRLPSAAEVAAAEGTLGVRFHPDYRRYLLEASDIVFDALEPAQVTPGAGHLGLVQVVAGARSLGVPVELLPFCEDNGDYYCLTPIGSVRFWAHDGTTDESWPDLATWIRDVWIGEAEAE